MTDSSLLFLAQIIILEYRDITDILSSLLLFSFFLFYFQFFHLYYLYFPSIQDFYFINLFYLALNISYYYSSFFLYQLYYCYLKLLISFFFVFSKLFSKFVTSFLNYSNNNFVFCIAFLSMYFFNRITRDVFWG